MCTPIAAPSPGPGKTIHALPSRRGSFLFQNPAVAGFQDKLCHIGNVKLHKEFLPVPFDGLRA